MEDRFKIQSFKSEGICFGCWTETYKMWRIGICYKEKTSDADRKGFIHLRAVKTIVKKTYKGVLFLTFLSILLLCTVLLLAFLADPQAMYEFIKQTFGVRS
jgi:hypothetical protein